MSTLLVGECSEAHLYKLWDADGASEAEFEAIVARALGCVYQNYHCIVFGGSFRLENSISRPDLALIANDFSHWFVIEVELVSHSLDRHVVPQVRTFRYGDPLPDCISILVREMKLDAAQVETFLKVVPRGVAVIANRRHLKWEVALKALEVQLLTVAAYRSPSGVEALEIDGQLEVFQEHLGYGQFFATDRTLRFPRSVKLPDGQMVINDQNGSSSLWTVARDSNYAWVTKNAGVPDLTNNSLVQLVRAVGGQFSIRPSLSL
ncbi:MAG: hypothetical protein J0H10_08045 [Alphaproteobacteria bacterium]|nr:hypothetical protein [Alphaproteobacteria bacterium]